MKKLIIAALLALTMAIASGCAETESRATGVYMLLDTSGTYAQELKKAQNIINYLLANLNPGDTLAVARIDTGSFSEKDIVAKIQFDQRPSTANTQKRNFQIAIDDFVKTVKPSRFTDISGGVLQAIEYLNEAGVGRKYILIFSDLQEELPAGYVRDVPFTLQGNFQVVALNVTKLRTDNVDPKEYLDRLDEWKSKIESGGGEFKVINDLDRLEQIFR